MKVNFMGQLMDMVVASGEEEWECKFFAIMKTRAMGCKDGLPALPYEKWLLDDEAGRDLQVPSCTLPRVRYLRMLTSSSHTCYFHVLTLSRPGSYADLEHMLTSCIHVALVC